MKISFFRTISQSMALFLILVAQAHAAPSCTKSGEVCDDATPCRTINGVSVCLAAQGQTCWHYSDTFNCVGGTQNTCQPLINEGCNLVNSKCLTYLADGVTCSTYDQTYQCVQTPAQTSTSTSCNGTTFCLNGQCYNLANPQNQDMSQVAAMMELGRQAGNYQDPATMQFFKGTGNSCTDTLGGIANCCTVGNPSTQTNAALLGGIAVNLGTPYVMDALGWTTGSAPSMISKAYTFLSNGGTLANIGSVATTPWSMMGVTVDLSDSATTMFAFDPTSLAISLAIMVVEDLLNCTQDEQMLSTKRGSRLCISTGSYCSMEVPVIHVCLQTTETYCCYNSILARIINEQGWAQLGLSLQPSCAGFTQAQLSSIDFSKMNLTEFMASIQSTINIPAIQSDMQSRINSMGNSNGATSSTANTPVQNPSAGGYTGGFQAVLPP